MFDSAASTLTPQSKWTCPPQVRDLPRDLMFGVTCRECGRGWSQSVRHLIDDHHLGAEYVDLLEWKYRCEAEDCGGMVDFAFPKTAGVEAHARPVAPKKPMGPVSFPAYPIKAVVKPRVPGGAVPLTPRQPDLLARAGL